MAKFKTPKQRERHMRIFRSKLSTYDKAHLKKLLDKAWDSWTWDTGNSIDKEKIELLEKELKSRKDWEGEHERRWAGFTLMKKVVGSHQKRRKKYREMEHRVNKSYERTMRKYGRKSNT